MRSLLAGLRTLTLPWGATTSPRIVLGPKIPATLVKPPFTFVAAIIEYFNATEYKFEAVGFLGATPVHVVGTYDTTHGVFITTYELLPTASDPLLVFGGPFNATRLEIQIANSELIIGSDGNITTPVGTEIAWGNQAIGYDTAGFISTAGAEVAIAAVNWVLEPAFLASTDRLYRFRWRGQLGATAPGGMYGTVRVRIGSGTVVGTEVARTYVDSPTNAWSPTRSGWGYGRYTGGGAVLNASLTLQKNAGAAGNILLDSDANSPIIVEIDDMGDAAVNTQIAAVAVPFA